MAMHPIAHRLPLPDGTPLLARPAELAALAGRDGVVLLRGIAPAAAVLDLGTRFTAFARQLGWIIDGQVQPGVGEHRGQSLYRDWYRMVQRERAFHALAHTPALVAAMSAIVGGDVLVHPRTIARGVGPDTARFTTPPHQDTWYIHGTTDTWTAWMPLGDCPRELGGLALLPGSHRGGTLEREPADGAGGSGVASELSDTWSWEPLSAGDAIVFHGQTVHQGCDNLTDRLRLSVDYRYQRSDLPVHASSLQPHVGALSWDEIHADWAADDPLRNYWRRQVLMVVD